MDCSPFVAMLLEYVGLPLVLGLVGWGVTKLPGPLRDALGSAVHQRDLALVVGAAARRAQAQRVPDVPTGQGPEDIVAYLKAELPDLIAKMGATDRFLQTTAGAAIETAAKPVVAMVESAPAQGLPIS
jgi:hypothetical protein